MKSRPVKLVFVSLLVFILSFPYHAFAEKKTFIKEYTYQAGDEDSKNSCRVISLREVKRSLLEELGTYLESETEVKDFRLTKDQITTLTAGIVQVELIGEKWDTVNLKYWLKAKIVADSSDVARAIESLRKDRGKTKELEEIRKRSDDLLKENERLRKELSTAKGEKRKNDSIAYNKTIEDLEAAEWFEKLSAMNYGIKEAWSEVERQLARRNDLIPDIVLTVKGYAMQEEKEVLAEVTNALTNVNSARSIPDKIVANNELSSALDRLRMAVAGDKYLELRTSEVFMRLQDELAGVELRISVEIRRYNEEVKNYNNAISTGPGRIIAEREGLKKAVFFELPKKTISLLK